MTLRSRLLAFSSAQLVAFGLLVAVGYWQFRARVLPMLDDSLRVKAESAIAGAGGNLDVALGADDQKMIEGTVAGIVTDPDFQFVEIRDAAGKVRYTAGAGDASEVLTSPAHLGHATGDAVGAWTDVRLEGIPLGTIVLLFDAGRISALRTWTTVLALIALAVWLGALAYSLVFSRAFVRPINLMMEFARRVAGGELGAKLDTNAPGELRELSENLDQMSAELAEREAERRRASAKEAELQRELISVSRMAGMAEVATGVLHNVGNVLNSLNVSVSVVGDRLKQSKVASLTRTVEMFAAHPDGLPGLLTTEKGKLIPQFLATVSQRLVEEHALVQGELAAVAQNVDHIKTIVATQQAYAQVAGVSEPVELGKLIDDALHMSEASFARHHVEVVRDYGKLPTLNTDRHKLLQIIINLVSNARHALKDHGQGGKLTVRLDRRGDEIAIIVRDTGVGISAENLARVFQHGFTTKKGGHGFGLHSCANAAREMGGSISAASDGAGQGATFTLVIPMIAQGRTHELTN